MGKALIAVAVLVVIVILGLGLYTLWKGGDTAAAWSNKLMRLRIIAQAIAIALILAVLALSQSGHH